MKTGCLNCALAVFLAASLSSASQEYHWNLDEVLTKEELQVVRALEAANGDTLKSVRALVNAQAGLVDLHFNRPLTANDTALLQRISKLGTLFFAHGTPTLTDERLSFLKDVEMQGLVIWGQPISDDGLKILKDFPKLRELSLEKTKITDAGLASLSGTQQRLRKLWVNKSDITDVGLQSISRLDRLEDLNLFSCSKITNVGVGHLASLVNLERLFLNNDPLLTSAVLAKLTTLKKLKRLEIDAIKLDQDDLRHLQNVDQLETLALNRTAVADEGIKHLAVLKSLKELNLTETKITDASLSTLKGLPELVDLGLGRTHITDAGLAHLSEMRRLTHLNLSKTKISDSGLVHLRAYPITPAVRRAMIAN